MYHNQKYVIKYWFPVKFDQKWDFLKDFQFSWLSRDFHKYIYFFGGGFFVYLYFLFSYIPINTYLPNRFSKIYRYWKNITRGSCNRTVFRNNNGDVRFIAGRVRPSVYGSHRAVAVIGRKTPFACPGKGERVKLYCICWNENFTYISLVDK